MRRRAAAIGAASALAAIGAAPRADADDLLVKAVALAEQELYDDGTHLEHRFPFTPAEGFDAKTITAHVARVVVGQRPDLQRIQAFAVEVVPDGEPTLVVVVRKPELVAQPATYEVGLELKGRKKAADAKQPEAPKDAEVTQTVTLKLVHPAARLRPPPTLLISRSRLPLFDFAWGDYPLDFELTETSQRSQLTNIVLRQLDAPLHGGEPVRGGMKRQTPQPIGPGKTVAVSLSLEGSFPVGTTKGRLEVSAPQLEAPVQLDYEVHARVTTFAIPVVFLAGVGLGQWIRGRLQKREEDLDRELRASDVRARLQRLADRSGFDDAAALRGKIKELDEAKGQGAALEQQIVKASELLAATLAARATKQRELLAKLARELAILGQGWVLPPAMAVASVADSLQTAQQRAADDDLVGAESADHEAAQRARALARSARDWAAELVKRLDGFARLSYPAGAKVPAAIEAARSAAAAIKAEPGAGTLEPLLRAVHAANDAGLELARQLADALSALADEAARDAQAPEADDIRRAARPLIADAERADAERALGRLAEAADALDETVRAAVSTILPTGAAGRGEVDQHLAARRYHDALRRAWELKQAAETEDISSFESSEPMKTGAPEQGGVPLLRGPQPLPGGSTNLFVVSQPGGAAEGERATMARQLHGARARRAWATAAVVAALTWALYDAEFAGTARELLTLFALGFTSNLTADTLAGALERAKSKP
jgi:hypothetical protein